jgi:hypothetical protein
MENESRFSNLTVNLQNFINYINEAKKQFYTEGSLFSSKNQK